MLATSCNRSVLLRCGSIDHRGRRFCEMIPEEDPGRPVSRILLYPAIHLRERTPGLLLGAAPTMSGYPRTEIWLARTGGLPGRSLAGYRRWALTPPFHPSPVPGGHAPPGACPPGHRLGCSLFHFTWRGGFAP